MLLISYILNAIKTDVLIIIYHLPSSPRNLSGLKTSGCLKCLGSLMMKDKFGKKIEIGGNEKPSTSTEVLVT